MVTQIMSQARTDFGPKDTNGQPGIRIDHLELVGSGSESLPEEDREFGADRLLAARVLVVLGGKDASASFPGFQDVTYFAVDAEGDLLGAVGTYSDELFDLESPDPGWLAWGDKVEDLDVAYDLFGCLQPH